jgi:hypothetical protein
MKSSFHSLIPFLPSLLSHSATISRDSILISQLPEIHIIWCQDKPTENTASNSSSIVGHCRRNMFAKQLPSNGRLFWLRYSGFQASCHIASPLSLFIPNVLQAYHHFFFSEGCACNVCDRSHLPSCGSVFLRCLLSHCSLLKATHLERVPDRVPVDPGVSPSSCFSSRWWGQNSLEWPVLLHFQLLLCVQSLLLFRTAPIPPQCPDPHFPKLTGNPDCSLHSLQSENLPDGLLECPLAF